jgi:xanthine/uracil permease
MTALNIWNKGRLKLFCILIGMVVGYLASGAVSLLTFHALRDVLHRPLLALPPSRESPGRSTGPWWFHSPSAGSRRR